MKNSSPLFLLLCFCLLLSRVTNVVAHDPGLSRANIELLDSGMSIEMVFSPQDVEAMVPLDENLDGNVSAVEFLVGKSVLESAMAAGVSVQSVGRLISPERVRSELLQNGGIKTVLEYRYVAPSDIDVSVPLIARLARGHRQYLTVREKNGSIHSQHMLDGTSDSLSVSAPEQNSMSVFRKFVVEGAWHIWIGFDHILFLLTLLLPAVLVYRRSGWVAQPNVRMALIDIVKVVTAFTVAHSITLALAATGVITPPSRVVESVIALSVLITAINNLRPMFPSSRWALAFFFGLLHGFGFAGVLMELELSKGALASSLLGFNIGVELGQFLIVSLVFPIAAALRYTRLYQVWLFQGGSVAAAMVATVWMFERAFNYELISF